MQAHKVKVGSAISVYWPEDDTWYHGEVISLDDATGSCEVLYEDGEREVIKLKEEKYKISSKDHWKASLLANGDVNMQLASIREILYDIEDRLPAKGVSSSRQGWWQAWHLGIDSAVEARSIPLLVPFVEKLARMIRPSIKTDWWKSQGEQECLMNLGSVKTSAELFVCVNELLTKGVNWRKARQFFPACNRQTEAKQSLRADRAESKRRARRSLNMQGQLYAKKVSHISRVANMDSNDKVTQGWRKGQQGKVDTEEQPTEVATYVSMQTDKVKSDCSGSDTSNEPKETSDKSETSSSGGSFDDKPNHSPGHIQKGQSAIVRNGTRSKRKSEDVKLSEGQKSARIGKGSLSRLHQGLLRVGASRSRSQKGKSDEGYHSEASEEASYSSSEGFDQGQDISEDEGDGYFQEGLKKKTQVVKKRGKAGKNERRSESPAPSDDILCAVCKFAGSAEMMLLCDGLKCDKALHSFCLAIPLQSIPDGDWLCPICVHQGTMAVGSSKVSKELSELIPPIKKIKAILGMREDPSECESVTPKGRNFQYLVKWSSLSHQHDTWVPEDWLLHFHRQRLLNYRQR